MAMSRLSRRDAVDEYEGISSLMRERAKAKRVVILGRNPKLTHHQRQEAIARREAGGPCWTSAVSDTLVLCRQPLHPQPPFAAPAQ
jgi:hypothetical protein